MFNTKEIIDALESEGEYRKRNVRIKEWKDENGIEDDSDNLMFVVEDKEENTSFLGVVNFMFQREGYCLDNFMNGDLYFGYYLNDRRNKQGFYTFKPRIKDNIIINEYYYGLWKDDLIHGRGINLWLKLKKGEKPFEDFDKANFIAFVGNCEFGSFKKGALLSKEKDDYFLYYGTFSKDGQKEGNNCFYYSSKLEQLYFGTFKGGVFQKGYFCLFDEEGNIKDLAKYNTDEEKKYIDPEKFGENEINEKSKILTNFRNVIMSKDYFGILFEEFKKMIEFRDENMNSLENLISEKYIDIMMSFSSFNNISISKDIEKYVEY